MLPETRFIEDEIIPYLKQTAEQTVLAANAQLSLFSGEAVKPLLLLTCASPWEARFPEYDLSEIHFDAEKMFASQIRGAVGARAAMSAAAPSVRSNMGCGAYNTLFGVEQMIFADKMPWIQNHLSKDALLRMRPGDIDVGRSIEFSQALSQMKYMKEKLDGTGVSVYPIDLQGPVDIAHMALGDQFFYELYDDEEFVRHLMELSVAAISVGTRASLEAIGGEQGFIAHYNSLVMPICAPLKISEDTSTLLSGEFIERFALPYTQMALDEFGGGYMHYCGVNANLFRAALNTGRFIGLNLGNPEKHDMTEVIRLCAENGKVYYGYAPPLGGESRLEWFTRLVKASVSDDGKARLLFHLSCETDEIESVKYDWLSAGGAII